LTPDFVAGHSLGEYSALVAAGALKFSDAVQLVRKRGTYMQEGRSAGRRRDGGCSGDFARRCGGRLPARGARRSLLCSEFEFAGADSDFGACGGAVKARYGDCIAAWCEARGDFAGVGAIPFGADDAGAGKARGGSGDSAVFPVCAFRW